VEVDDAVEGLVIVLESDPVPDRAEVIPEVTRPGGLDPAEDALLPRILKALVQG
jgi:hypothetical protein